jgi:HSP20 family protein
MGGDLLLDLHREMNRLFDDAFRGGFPAIPGDDMLPGFMAAPRIDMHETDNELNITADLPGVNQSEVDIRIEGDRLTLSGERRQESETKKQNFHVMERSYGNFRRTLQLPFAPDPEKVEARFDNGVLNIQIAKQPQQERSRRIEVRGSESRPSIESSAESTAQEPGGPAGQAQESAQETAPA